MARFVYGSRENIAGRVMRGTTTYRLISDQLGTPHYAVNEANINDVPYQVTWGYAGQPVVAGGLPQTALDWIPFGYAGGIYDRDTGLVHFGAREYDPTTMRWMSKDPIRFYAKGANLYADVGNDPINRRDTKGKDWEDIWGAAKRCYGVYDKLLGTPLDLWDVLTFGMPDESLEER